MKYVNPRKILEQEAVRIREEAQELPVGSEDFLNAMKALNQCTEASTKMRKVDANVLIPAAGSLGVTVLWYILTETRIVDTRPIQFIRGLFKR